MYIRSVTPTHASDAELARRQAVRVVNPSSPTLRLVAAGKTA